MATAAWLLEPELALLYQETGPPQPLRAMAHPDKRQLAFVLLLFTGQSPKLRHYLRSLFAAKTMH